MPLVSEASMNFSPCSLESNVLQSKPLLPEIVVDASLSNWLISPNYNNVPKTTIHCQWWDRDNEEKKKDLVNINSVDLTRQFLVGEESHRKGQYNTTSLLVEANFKGGCIKFWFFCRLFIQQISMCPLGWFQCTLFVCLILLSCVLFCLMNGGMLWSMESFSLSLVMSTCLRLWAM